MAEGETHRAIEAVFRIERARLIAGLARISRDIGRAEELAQDALSLALAEWPRSGVPDRTRRLADGRGQASRDRRLPPRTDAGRASTPRSPASSTRPTRAPGGGRGGARRRSRRRAARADLHRLPSGPRRRGAGGAHPRGCIGGLTTDEIARAFLSSEATIAQRIVRAKKATRRRRRPRLRGAARRRAGGAARLGARGRLPGLQRGLCRHRRRRPGAPGPLRRGAAARAHPRRARAGRARGLGPARADGPPGVAAGGADRTRRRSDPADRAEPRAAGTSC